jgi:drug/metabolite transporter (DMT)-like permease
MKESRAGLMPYVWVLCGCFWFAAMGLLIHNVGQPMDDAGTPSCPWTIVAFVRSFVAMIFATILAVSTGAKLVFFKSRSLMVRSFAGSTSMMATFYAFSHLHPTEVLTLTNTSPIWVALLAWPLAGEKPTWGVVVAIAFSVSGVAIAVQPQSDGFALIPALFALFAAFFTAVAMLGLNRLKGIAPFAVVAHFSAVSTLFGAVGWILADVLQFNIDAKGDPQWFEHSWVWAEIVGIGMTATIGQVFLTLAFSRGNATRVAIVGLSQVVIVMICEAVLGWKALSSVMMLGTAMVLGPTAWLMSRAKRKTITPVVNE